jgi:hypothetical protein
VYTLEQEADGKVVAKSEWRSRGKYKDSMYLNVCERHYSYIHDLELYTQSWRCQKCAKLFDRKNNHDHHVLSCDATVRHIFPGGGASNSKTIFDKLEDAGIKVGDHGGVRLRGVLHVRP